MYGIKRNLEPRINELLSVFPVVLIVGARQSGKTTIAKRVRPAWKYFDLEKGSDQDFITRDYDFFFKENPTNLILDEAQLEPHLFSELRGVIDKNRQQKNRFLLTGSSSPELIKNAAETLAGRIAIVELGTLKLNEYLQQPLSSFYKLFTQPITNTSITKLKKMKPQSGYEDVLNFFLSGGYPEPVLENNKKYFLDWMENYFQTYLQRDIRRLFPKLDIVRYRRFIQMLSSLSGTIINRAQIARGLDVSEPTIKDYLDIAESTYVWRNIQSFTSTKTRSLIKSPKGIFRDSGLNNFLKQIIMDRETLLSSPSVGFSFEAFVTEEIIKGLQATLSGHWEYSYYRTRNGAEIDLILSGPFGIVPAEIKFGLETSSRTIPSLINFVNDNDLPLGLVVNNCSEPKLICEKILQIPASLL